jgi:hypothetical protein
MVGTQNTVLTDAYYRIYGCHKFSRMTYRGGNISSNDTLQSMLMHQNNALLQIKFL